MRRYVITHYIRIAATYSTLKKIMREPKTWSFSYCNNPNLLVFTPIFRLSRAKILASTKTEKIRESRIAVITLMKVSE